MTMQPSSEVKRLWLTVDQGNSSTKFVVWEGEPGAVGAAARVRGDEIRHGDGGLAELLEDLGRGAFEGVGLSSVASLEARGALLDGGLGEMAADGGEVRCPEAGLVLGVRHPETLGEDRKFAARGAVELAGGSAGGLVVVDAGTALTVDCVLDGVFLGGAIAPGPRLLAAALESGGARLFGTELVPGAPALGRDSCEALEAGVMVGFRGAARGLVLWQLADSAMAGAHSPRVFLTGGARDFLKAPFLFTDFPVTEVPDLVHLGLLAAMWSELEY